MTATLLNTIDIDVDAIRIDSRLRPVSEVNVTSLIASINEIGLQQEIVVRKSRHRGGHLYLIAGGHRLEAFRRMGRQKVPAKVYDCTDDWAKLAEIDDNLAHANLEPLDLAVFLAERKVVYERMYPETKAGVFKGNRHTGSLVSDTMSPTRTGQNDMVSFCQSVAQNHSMSKRHVERFVAAGQALDAKSVDLLRKAPARVTFADLQTIAKAQPDERPIICRELSVGNVKSAKQVLDRRKQPGANAGSDADKKLAKLDDAWARAPKSAKRRFVEMHKRELFDLLGVEQFKDADSGLSFSTRRGS